mmetsp:Transcript_33106/g.84937  ORF Transcript_33106/g.84937 Transcript_33106/m.84937 type:complete len:202 (+) Transcript_33106:663-1268(+)
MPELAGRVRRLLDQGGSARVRLGRDPEAEELGVGELDLAELAVHLLGVLLVFDDNLEMVHVRGRPALGEQLVEPKERVGEHLPEVVAGAGVGDDAVHPRLVPLLRLVLEGVVDHDGLRILDRHLFQLRRGELVAVDEPPRRGAEVGLGERLGESKDIIAHGPPVVAALVLRPCRHHARRLVSPAGEALRQKLAEGGELLLR